MIKNLRLIIVLCLNLAEIFAYYDLSQQYLLTSKDTFLQCSPTLHNQGVFQGETIFSTAGITDPTIQEITLSGWYMLKNDNAFQITLFSIKDGGALIFTMQYTMISQLFYYEFKSYGGTLADPELKINIWKFIKVQIILSLISTTHDQVNIGVFTSPGPLLSSIQTFNTGGQLPMSFDRSSMVIHYGSINGANYNPCAIFRYIVAYLNPQPWDDSLVSSYHSKLSVETYLLWNYDFFYSYINNQQLLSTGKQQGSLSVPSLSTTTPMQIQQQKIIYLGDLDNLEETGFIIYFEFKMDEIFTSEIKLLQIIKQTQGDLFTIQWNTNGIVMLCPLISACVSTGLSLSLGSWYQFVVIVNLFHKQTVSLIINGSSIYEVSSVLSDFQTSLLAIKFGNESNLNVYSLDNIRVYRGTFVTQTDSCYIMTARSEKHCLICQTNYFLSYQNNMQCILNAPLSSRSYKIIIVDWTRINCPTEMIYDAITNTCICFNKYYDSGSTCLGCLDYCATCGDSLTCTESDTNRDMTGQCAAHFYDDEYSCISDSYSIPHRQNTVKMLPALGSNIESAYQLRNIELKWDSTSTSFFLGFFIDNRSLNDSTIANQLEILAYIKEEGQSEMITIYTYYVIANQYTVICFNVQGSQTCYLGDTTLSWIGVWTDFTTVQIFVGFRGQVITDQRIFSLSSITNMVVCVGTCSLVVSGGAGHYEGTLGSRPITFIRDIQFPTNQIPRFFELNGEPTIMCVNFEAIYSERTYYSDINSLNSITSIPETADIQLYITSGTYQALKGFYVNPGYEAIIGSFSYGSGLSLSVNLFIQSLSDDIGLLEFDFPSISVRFSLVQHLLDDQISIRICLNYICKSTEYAFLSKNTPQFLAILMRDMDPVSPEITYLMIDVLCNYKKEQLSFHLNTHANLIAKTNIRILNNDNYVYYFNNLKFYVNYDFYFDYTATDYCLLYYNIADMYCIKAKKGKTTYKGQVVDPADCQSFTSSYQQVSYNPFTMECMIVYLPHPQCQKYSNDQSICLTCSDENADPDNCMVCKDGFYNESSAQNECRACHPKCMTCSLTFDNCTQCQNGSTQAPPDCSCIQSNQYVDSNFQCQDCSPQCDSCTYFPSECITCSDGRVSPPMCDCDPTIYDSVLSTNEICKKTVCSYHCESCQIEETNCLSCAMGFENPPECSCPEGYYDDINQKQCASCGSHQFLASGSTSCSECDFSCKSCSQKSTICTECYDTLVLFESSCVCSDLSPFALSSSGDIVCAQYMDVNLKVELKNSIYYLVFTFENDLNIIDFTKDPIDSLIFIYISQVQTESFSITDQNIEGKTLKLQLTFESTFSASSGYTTFIMNQPFSSATGNAVLDPKYLSTPLKFDIGPLVIPSSQWSSSQQLEALTGAVQSANPELLTTIRQFQFVFYILNTLQPCVAFLMVKITIPPNLYQLLQFIGLLLFPNVPAYGTTSVKKDYSILGISLQAEKDYSENASEVFRKFSFCNQLLVNNLVTSLTTLAWPILLLFTYLCSQVSVSNKILAYASKTVIFCISKINDNCEVALLLVTTSAFNQFLNLNNDQYLNRISVYTAIVILIILLSFNISNYINLGIEAIEANGGYTEQNPYMTLVQKLDFQSRPLIIRRYFIFQQARKYLLAGIIVFIEKYPSVVCALCSSLFSASMLVSLKLRPYKSKWGNISKIGGEACLTAVWLIFAFKFIPFQRFLQHGATVPSQEIDSFLSFGNAAVIILLLFNLLYVVEFIWIQVICKVSEFIEKRRKQKPQQIHGSIEISQLKSDSSNQRSADYILGKAFFQNKIKNTSSKLIDKQEMSDIQEVFYNKADFAQEKTKIEQQDETINKQEIFYNKQSFTNSQTKLDSSGMEVSQVETDNKQEIYYNKYSFTNSQIKLDSSGTEVSQNQENELIK